MFVGFHGEEDFVSYFTVGIVIIGISNMSGVWSFSVACLLFDQFPVNETGIALLSTRACFWTCISLCVILFDRNIKAYLFGFVVLKKNRQGKKLRFTTT